MVLFSGQFAAFLRDIKFCATDGRWYCRCQCFSGVLHCSLPFYYFADAFLMIHATSLCWLMITFSLTITVSFERMFMSRTLSEKHRITLCFFLFLGGEYCKEFSILKLLLHFFLCLIWYYRAILLVEFLHPLCLVKLDGNWHNWNLTFKGNIYTYTLRWGSIWYWCVVI